MNASLVITATRPNSALTVSHLRKQILLAGFLPLLATSLAAQSAKPEAEEKAKPSATEQLFS